MVFADLVEPALGREFATVFPDGLSLSEVAADVPISGWEPAGDEGAVVGAGCALAGYDDAGVEIGVDLAICWGDESVALTCDHPK